MNKKIIILLLAIGLVMNFVSAFQLEIQDETIANVIAQELSNPAVFKLRITNYGGAEQIEIFSLSGVDITPSGFFTLPTGESTIELGVIPQESLIGRIKGPFTVSYTLRSIQGDSIKEKLIIELIELDKILKISPVSLTPADNEITLTIENKEKALFKDIDLEISSLFFSKKIKLSIGPKENALISIPVDKEQFQKISADSYVITAKVYYGERQSSISGVLDYVAQESFAQESKSSGFFVKEMKLIKTNDGNTNAQATLNYEQNFITRLFTTFSLEQTSTERKGFKVKYYWEENLAPQESLIVIARTNYTLPIILILLVIIISVLIRIYYRTALILVKRVSFVKTKGGEFALKVKLHIKATKSLENIEIEDRLPSMVKLYEKFGKMPDSVDLERRALKWKIQKLTSGEERVFSYIIYSKLKVFGTFTLPSAKASFTSNGEREVIFSNQASFAADTSLRDE